MRHREDHDEESTPSENRFRVGHFTAGDIALFKDIAEVAAENAVQKTFVAMGHDPKEPLTAQLDAAWTRRWRIRGEGIVGKIMVTIAGLATVGGATALWSGIKAAVTTSALLPR